MAYSEQEKLKCASMFIAGESIRAISKKRDPSRDAISNWKQEGNWEEHRDSVQDKLNLDEEADKIARVKKQFIKNLPAVASKLVKEVNRRAEDGELEDESLRSLSTAFGVIVDKWQLMTGEATERVEKHEYTADEQDKEKIEDYAKLLKGRESIEN